MAMRAGAGILEHSVILHPLSPADAAPLGDMPLAPFAMTKRTEADLAQAIADPALARDPEKHVLDPDRGWEPAFEPDQG